MAQYAVNEIHAQQIEAGKVGRNKGHKFESQLVQKINSLSLDKITLPTRSQHIIIGDTAKELISYVISKEKLKCVDKVKAYWLGGLATGKSGDTLTDENGNIIKKCKSDIIIDFEIGYSTKRIGVSVKTCSKKTPTNDQLYFTTASAFCRLLRTHNIEVSENAEKAMKMFCGDEGFRPIDNGINIKIRKSDPERYFWEELNPKHRAEWEKILSDNQDDVTRILLQKAYLDDPYVPEYVLHQRCAAENESKYPLAIFSIEELIMHSSSHAGYHTKPYKVKKGRYKGDPNEHLAPRFGFVQFQRGGQKQHPTQLQFNLRAGYFNYLSNDA